VVNASTGEPKSTNDDFWTLASLYALYRADANLFQRLMVEFTGISSLHLSSVPGSFIACLLTYELIDSSPPRTTENRRQHFFLCQQPRRVKALAAELKRGRDVTP
jgi:hypothetical protein